MNNFTAHCKRTFVHTSRNCRCRWRFAFRLSNRMCQSVYVIFIVYIHIYRCELCFIYFFTRKICSKSVNLFPQMRREEMIDQNRMRKLFCAWNNSRPGTNGNGSVQHVAFLTESELRLSLVNKKKNIWQYTIFIVYLCVITSPPTSFYCYLPVTCVVFSALIKNTNILLYWQPRAKFFALWNVGGQRWAAFAKRCSVTLIIPKSQVLSQTWTQK